MFPLRCLLNVVVQMLMAAIVELYVKGQVNTTAGHIKYVEHITANILQAERVSAGVMCMYACVLYVCAVCMYVCVLYVRAVCMYVFCLCVLWVCVCEMFMCVMYMCVICVCLCAHVSVCVC
eukprot:GHVS01094759.1.p1 GENE.GHVS01094759.1~~GHVS01094759.1.p1  ORF type:complete len:121 (+),score=11.31 GHVS01094759.1:387-749(+)